MATVSKLFKRPEEVDQAVAELKGMGCSPSIIDESNEGELSRLNLSEQALDYYKIGLMAGGKVVAADVEDAKAKDANSALHKVGIWELTERPAQWSSSPGFTKAVKMSSTNPIDAQMSGDFRKY